MCGIAVYGLTAADDEVRNAYLADGHGEGVARGKGVGTTKGTVGEEDSIVGTTIEGIAEHIGSLGKTHGQHSDGGTGELFLQTKCLLQSVEVFWIEDGRQCATIDGAFGGHGIRTNVARVRYLLCKHNNFQTHKWGIYDLDDILLVFKIAFWPKLTQGVARFHSLALGYDVLPLRGRMTIRHIVLP